MCKAFEVIKAGSRNVLRSVFILRETRRENWKAACIPIFYWHVAFFVSKKQLNLFLISTKQCQPLKKLKCSPFFTSLRACSVNNLLGEIFFEVFLFLGKQKEKELICVPIFFGMLPSLFLKGYQTHFSLPQNNVSHWRNQHFPLFFASLRAC